MEFLQDSAPTDKAQLDLHSISCVYLSYHMTIEEEGEGGE